MEALSIKEIAKAVDGKILCGDENSLITFVSTNSKNTESGALFVPIIGEKTDAHNYIEDAFSNGAIACLTSRHQSMHHKNAYIAVQDTLQALQALGTYYRNKFHIPVIGITGSVGKTTTKEMVAAALTTRFKVLKTEGNMNSQVGLPLMMLRFNYEHQIAVIEMGMSEEGEMEKLTKIAQPDIAIMTNIGVSHIAQLKTRENIRTEKLNIVNAFNENSVLYLNGSDDLLCEVYQQFTQKSQVIATIDMSKDTKERLKKAGVVAFGIEDFCNYRAEDIRMIDGETRFTLKADDDNEDSEEIILKVLGIHNVYNALAALAVAKHYGIPTSVAKEGLYGYQPIAMRGQIKEVNQIKIIDDTYNASPDSMKSGIRVLMELNKVTRRIAVLADVLELGEQSYQCHYDVGVYIAEQKMEELITIGSEAAAIAQAVQERNLEIIVHSYQKNEDAISYLKKNLKAGDAVLVKGSRSMRTDEIVKALSE